MEPTTVVGCVAALTDLFAEGAGHYTAWKRKRSRQNHYRRSGPPGQKAVVTCALSTSLDAAETQIKEAYDIAFSIIGSDFSMGDGTCRDLLCNQLFNLQSRVSHLRRATDASCLTATLNISDLLQTSESIRIASVKALSDLYSRVASGLDVPKDLPVPKPRSRQSGLLSRRSGSFTDRSQDSIDDDDDGRTTTVLTIRTDQPRFQSEPPSPPPTPPDSKPTASDSASVVAPSAWASSEADGSGGTTALCPKVSVFSMFCPEAMVLQVDLSKPVPKEKRCICGYRWKPTLPEKQDFILLKDGFRMSSRFLAKSHSDKDAFGCILCVSSGKTETYDSPQSLCAHINASHTKWQMLHERDIS
ncbi:hypothetical protein CkaCkLH20_13150 [Colletotrichum karsti]|uniref:Uncharacterized protein n=1 Tax=Colletotrichum karsti TaxID=1095194 RepID=A0A9P6HV70_9PEZI|nr:uncharacterized protein CkaCkLH20_13150 [Colletotrichum karsti]KAF9869381.1 hypothetical protein CkaCkLH20_13150 [Colletotrichum karsti]